MFEIKLIKLNDLISQIGDTKTKSYLSGFFCSKNLDVQYFIQNKAIAFEKTNKATTYLLFSIEDSIPTEILAYYTVAQQTFRFVNVSKTKIKKIVGHESCNRLEHPAILIGQIGRNEKATYRIEGKEIFKSIFSTIERTITTIGGTKFIYLELIHDEKLISIYESYGFKLLLCNDGTPSKNNGFSIMIMPVDDLKNVKK